MNSSWSCITSNALSETCVFQFRDLLFASVTLARPATTNALLEPAGSGCPSTTNRTVFMSRVTRQRDLEGVQDRGDAKSTMTVWCAVPLSHRGLNRGSENVAR